MGGGWWGHNRRPAWLYLLLLFGTDGVADSLIVNSGIEIQNITQNEARLYLTMRITQWPDGTPVKVFVLPDNHPLHQRVTKSTLGLYPYQLRRTWDRQLFSGTGQVPVTVASAADLIKRVGNTPGAIGYAGPGTLNPAVRSLEVR